MKNEITHALYLRFVDKEIGRKFIREYDCENRIFFRLGIYLSCFAWFIWYSGIYFSHHGIFGKALTILMSVLLIPFTLNFFKKYSTIIKAHGGEIRVETKESVGTTLIIELPNHSS